MSKEEETTTTYHCDLCGEEIESYHEGYNQVSGKDICDDCREKIYIMEKNHRGEK